MSGWVVGRDDAACYVEPGEVLSIGGMPTGEQGFPSEIEAVRYAIMCEEDAIGPLQRSLRSLRSRLRKLERNEQRAATIGQQVGGK